MCNNNKNSGAAVRVRTCLKSHRDTIDCIRVTEAATKKQQLTVKQQTDRTVDNSSSNLSKRNETKSLFFVFVQLNKTNENNESPAANTRCVQTKCENILRALMVWCSISLLSFDRFFFSFSTVN